MKKILFILAIGFFYVGILNVNASEIIYTNINGVSFTEEEYDFVSKILYNGYQDNMTLEEYNIILGEGVTNNILTNEYAEIMPLGTIHTTASKSLVITKAIFPSFSLITITEKWLVNPRVRSYDVIGAYLDGVSLSSTVSTRLEYSSSQYFSSYIKNDSNGFGVSVKLPDTGSDIKVTQIFRVTGSGIVHASYQHATSDISLTDSQKYTISRQGSGGVFLFNDSVNNIYDQMGGVYISI